MSRNEPWWAKGVFFENCNCQMLCRAHINFKQACDYERCIGHWAFHFASGGRGETSLEGLNAFIIADAPQVMYEGNWTQAIYIDERADDAQRRLLEDVFTGRAGGRWEILAGLIGTRLDTRYVPISYSESDSEKTMAIAGILETRVKAMRGAEKDQAVLVSNMFNQIHGDPQTFALGTTNFNDQGFSLVTSDTHAIWSEFSWQGP